MDALTLDHGNGTWEKNVVRSLQAQERRPVAWEDGTITASVFRTLLVTWAKTARDRLKAEYTGSVTTSAQRCSTPSMAVKTTW